MTNEEYQNFNNATECYICELPFEDQRIAMEEDGNVKPNHKPCLKDSHQASNNA